MKKLKEYSKRKKRDTSLKYLEFGSKSNSKLEIEQLDEREPKLEQEYHLPRLLKPPSLYNECILQLNKINNRFLDALKPVTL